MFDEHGLLTSTILVIPLTIIFICWVIQDRRHDRMTFARLTFELVLCGYLWLLFDMTLFPINLSANAETLAASGYTFQGAIATHPLALWYNWQQPTSLYQIIGNGLMLTPLTLLAGGLALQLRRFSRSVALAFGTSLFIECTQLVMNFFNLGDRTFDLNDLLLNTIGGIIGWLLLTGGLAIWRRL
ncbi:VanZ family protein [Furfurilactobacillus sp. WILCCON 0119]|uniref:VanZ family protein n=1 Tax=Furfurilactobacillus entadae TaxID=2922307 RepID=UPI0035E6098A